MSVSPKAKRKKEMTRKEVMEKLKQNENDISKAVQGLLEELCPFDVNDEEALKIEGRLERLQKASHIFECKMGRLKKQIKERKFRHNPELLDEKIISSSQFSLLDSQETQIVVDAEDEDEDQDTVDNEDEEWVEEEEEEKDGVRRRKYRKKPLDGQMSKFCRRRRLASKREVCKEWAREEGVSVTKLLGYIIHLENYLDDRDLSSAGWRLFQGGNLQGKPAMSVEEVIWLREKSGMSEAHMQELRLRLLDRWKISLMMIVCLFKCF